MVGDYLKAHCVHLAFHRHLGTVVENQKDVEYMLDNTRDFAGLLLDDGHLRGAGAYPLAIVRRYAQRVKHVHCKDVRFGVLDRLFIVPGDDDVDFLTHLNEAGFRIAN